MPRKIYDIKPPKVIKKMEKELKEFLTEDKKRKPAAVRQNKKQKKSILKPVLACVAIILVIAFAYLYFKLQKAEITIWPKVDTLSFQQTITADKSADSIDAVKEIIPAKYFESTKTDSQDFPATGSASSDGKATGAITVYNKYEPAMPFNFKAGTHFMSDSGKLFITYQKVSIPAAKKVGGKLVPGSVQINVEAVESGSGYNIAPSNFSIPGLKGTAYYFSVYGASTTAMSGGYTGKVKKVTDDDVQGAKDVLTKTTANDALDDLKSQISKDYIVLNNAVLTNTTSASTQTKVGAIADSFNYQATVVASALAFKKSDVEDFAKKYIVSQIPQGKTLLDSSFKIDYSASQVDVSGGKATLNLTFSSGVYKTINTNSMAISFFGEDKNQINENIKSSLGDDATKVNINFWPFWVTKAPNSQKAVQVGLRF